MSLRSIATAALLGAFSFTGFAQAQGVPAAAVSLRTETGEHGKLPWFPGTFEEALAQAKAKNQVVFIDFWTDWCGWCKRMDKDTFSDDSVVAEMKDIICVSIDAESKTGRPIAARFGVRGYPALLVLGPDGALRDQIGGYLAPADFKREIRRVREDKGTLSELRRRVEADKSNVEQRWELANKLQAVGDAAGRQREIAEIEKLDPQLKSLPGRWIAFEKVIGEIDTGWQKDQTLDPRLLENFLAAEKNAAVLFEGQQRLYSMKAWLAAQVASDKEPERARTLRTEAWAALRGAAAHCPPDKTVSFAGGVAQEAWKQRNELGVEEKAFVLELARKAQTQSASDPAALAALTRALQLNGKTDEAIATAERLVQLDPKSKEWPRLLEEVRGG